LFDISGKKLTSRSYTANQAEGEIDLSAFKQGVYLLKVSNNQSTATMQLIRK
jgi:hypothetical protein